MTAAADTCRFAVADPAHQCSRNDGSPLGPNGTCFYEASAQLREQADAEGTTVYSTDPTVYRMLATGAVSAARRQRSA